MFAALSNTTPTFFLVEGGAYNALETGSHRLWTSVQLLLYMFVVSLVGGIFSEFPTYLGR